MAAGDEKAEVTLGVAAVARRLGVATGTLRTWDRRYGLGPSAHSPGARRRYTARDVARLDAMHRLMLEGVSAADAARVARSADGDDPARRSLRPTDPPARAGGGRVVALPAATPAARGLARAATRLDGEAIDTALRVALSRGGVPVTWDDLLAPVLAGLEEHRRTTGRGLEAERLLTERAEAVLRASAPRAAPLPGLRPVLLAGISEEGRRLPLVALEAALAGLGLAVRFLGVRLPVAALSDATARLGPAVVVLWSQRPDADAPVPGPDVLARVRPRPALVLAGPGYRNERFHTGLTWAAGVPETVLTVAERIGITQRLTIGPSPAEN